MGHVYIDVELASIEKSDVRVSTRALVDTGATYSVIPASIAKKLELKNLGYVEVKTASGLEKLQEIQVRVKAFDKERIIPALVSERISIPLIGVVTIEILRLKLDPTTGKAEELPLLLYY